MYPNLSRSLEKMTLLHSFLNVACGDKKKRLVLNLAAHISSNEIMSAAVSSQKLALVSEDYHY